MNFDKLSKSIGTIVRLRPHGVFEVDDSWKIVDCSRRFGVCLRNMRMNQSLTLKEDHIHHFTSNLSVGNGQQLGFLELTVKILWENEAFRIEPMLSGPAVRLSKNTKGFDKATATHLVAGLKFIGASGQHDVYINFSTNKQQPMATHIKQLFIEAGWTCSSFCDVPLETGMQATTVGYIEGIEIKSANAELAERCAHLFREAGIAYVHFAATEHYIQPSNPKWGIIMKRICLTVGHYA